MLRFILAKLLFLTLAGSAVTVWLLACAAIFGKRLSHRAKYYLWLAALFSFLIPIAPIHTPSVADTSHIGAAAAPAPQDSAAAQTGFAGPEQAAPALQKAVQSMRPPRLLPDFGYNVQNSLLVCLGGLWLAVAISLFTKKRLAAFRFRRRLAPMLRSAGPQAEAVFAACKARFNIRGGVRLMVLENADSPFLTGLIRPAVVIPGGLDSQSLELVFCHELTHYRRRDLWYGLFAELVCQLHWFNPLIWLAAKKRRTEMEFSCDEAVASVMDETQKKAYVCAILRMTPRSRSLKNNSACLSESGIHVKKRLEAIMKHQKKKYSVLSAALAAIVLCTSVISVYAVNSQNPVTSAYTQNQAKSRCYFTYSRKCDPSEYGVDDNTGYAWGIWEAGLTNTPLKKTFTAHANLDTYTLSNGSYTAKNEGDFTVRQNGETSRKTKQADIRIEMTEFTEALSDGYVWKGKFTVTINGTPVMENQPGCLTNIPAAQSRGYTSLGIGDAAAGSSVRLSNLSFTQSGTDKIDAAAFNSKYCEALYSSPSKIDVCFDSLVSADYAGQTYPVPEDAWEYGGCVVADPAGQKVYANLSVPMGNEYMLVSSPYEDYAVTEDSASGMFYLWCGGDAYTDCFRGTLSGLSAGSETARFEAADGRLAMELHKDLLADSKGTYAFSDFIRHTEDPAERGYTQETMRSVQLADLPFTVTLEPDNQHVTLAYKQNTGIQRWYTAIATYNFNGNDVYDTHASSRGDSAVMTLPLLTDGSRHYIYAMTSQYEPYAVNTTYDISFNVVDGQLYFTNCTANTRENQNVSGYPAVLLWNSFYRE